MTTEQPEIDAPIHSIALHATAKYLGSLEEADPEKLSEGDKLLHQLFFQHSLLLTAVNSSITLSKQVTEAMQAQLAKMRGEEPEPAPQVEAAPTNIIVPDRF
jgi:hypothetical protein